MRQIPHDQILAKVRSDNPWWQEDWKETAPFHRWDPRPYLDLLYPLMTDRSVRRAVVLMGPRRVGKTWMIHHAIERLISGGANPKSIFYFSLERPLFTGLDLEELLRLGCEASGVDSTRESSHVFFDEVQYLPDWERHLKVLVDRHELPRFVVSGSAAAALRLKSQESGAGRFTDFLLPPLTFHEYLKMIGREGLIVLPDNDEAMLPETPNLGMLNRCFLDYINFGGYPELALTDSIRADPGRFIREDIIERVLLRDLPSLYGIDNIPDLNNLFTTLAFNTAQEVSLGEISKNSETSASTIRRYIEYLRAAFLVRTVDRVDQSARRFKRANFFKVYLTNPSMRTALFAPVSMDDKEMGALVETAIFSQYFHGHRVLRYARWKGGEVDCVALRADQSVEWMLEVKWSDRYAQRPGDLRPLLSFAGRHNVNRVWVTTRTISDVQTVNNVRIRFCPASLLCWAIGHAILTKRVTPMANTTVRL